MPDAELKVGGDDSFVFGADSYSCPERLNPGEYVSGMNIICRGGVAQTRPGSASLCDIPEGRLQGITFFRPSSSLPQLVFAVDGNVYVSASPFRDYFQIPNIKFSEMSQQIAWASCVQSTITNGAGVTEVLETPISVLVMGDGVTKCAYWDGASGRHLDPVADETPVGWWMAWSNNRLWISRESQIFASDIGNPLSFIEAKYLNEARSFYLPGDCTGIAETSDQQGIICFTAHTGTFLTSSIQDRDLWLSTPSFQKTILTNIGCISGRSIVHQYGLLWWYSAKGLISQNDAERLYISSRLDIQDNELFDSKLNLSHDLSGVCGSFIENFLFHAVPNGDKLNTRLHVLDQAPFEENASSWPGYWTGWRPVEFAKGIVGTKERVFCVSYDYDGTNRIWELFLDNKTDNGVPITCFLATKTHLFDDRDYKLFRYGEIEFTKLSGNVAVMVALRGTYGAFQSIMSKDISAQNGQIYADAVYGYGAHRIAGSRAQNRVLRTNDNISSSECNLSCIESPQTGFIDRGFSLLIAWSGIAGVVSYRIFAQSNPIAYLGDCEQDEDGPNLITSNGCGIGNRFNDEDIAPFAQYYAQATFTRGGVTRTSIQSSFISQDDANRKATQTAKWFVLYEIGEIL